MNIYEAKNEIINTVKAYFLKDEEGNYFIEEIRQRPVLLIGPPGVGKTQIMKQVATECNIGLVSYTITHHTRQSAVGLPMINKEIYDGKEYSVTEYTMSEIIGGVYKCIRDEGHKEGILFIDEINCVSETLIPTMLQFLQNKTFGNWKLPSGWIIVAAGNPPEYNRSVREFDMVTLDRLRVINVEADITVWKRYALVNEVHNAVISYLDIRPKNFYKTNFDVDGLKYVTARGWEDLSSLIKAYEKLGIKVNEATIKEYLNDDETAMDFSAYYDLYNRYKDDYGINSILDGEAPKETYQRIMKAEYDERLTVINLLLDALKNMFKLYDKYNSSDEKMNKSDIEAISQKLENAFTFIEEACADSDMLVFVTGLSLSVEAAIFLMDNPSDKFNKYSAKLLDGREEILRELI